MIVGRNQRGARLLQEPRRLRFACRQIGLARIDLAAISLDCATFDGRGGSRHDNVGWDAAQTRSQCQCLGVIARAVGHHAARGRFGIELRHGVARSAELECANFLEVFAFQKDGFARKFVKRRAGQHRSPMHHAGDAARGRADVFERYRVVCHVKQPTAA